MGCLTILPNDVGLTTFGLDAIAIETTPDPFPEFVKANVARTPDPGSETLFY